MNTVSMTVIGAGFYGTALAITLARNGHLVLLWRHILKLQQDCCNQAFLPNVLLPNNLLPEVSLKIAINSQYIDRRSKLCF
ncbi:hypothetical protein [Arsenophonus endosymbiont of Aleurodicus dispersus]|uniref:hypothetical protein n=1 Tax=Arsenophonus endosymbiont of Aleurodicus dispersus TaxID=235559 RepID=UPI003F759FEB